MHTLVNQLRAQVLVNPGAILSAKVLMPLLATIREFGISDTDSPALSAHALNVACDGRVDFGGWLRQERRRLAHLAVTSKASLKHHAAMMEKCMDMVDHAKALLSSSNSLILSLQNSIAEAERSLHTHPVSYHELKAMKDALTSQIAEQKICTDALEIAETAFATSKKSFDRHSSAHGVASSFRNAAGQQLPSMDYAAYLDTSLASLKRHIDTESSAMHDLVISAYYPAPAPAHDSPSSSDEDEIESQRSIRIDPFASALSSASDAILSDALMRELMLEMKSTQLKQLYAELRTLEAEVEDFRGRQHAGRPHALVMLHQAADEVANAVSALKRLAIAHRLRSPYEGLEPLLLILDPSWTSPHACNSPAAIREASITRVRMMRASPQEENSDDERANFAHAQRAAAQPHIEYSLRQTPARAAAHAERLRSPAITAPVRPVTPAPAAMQLAVSPPSPPPRAPLAAPRLAVDGEEAKGSPPPVALSRSLAEKQFAQTGHLADMPPPISASPPEASLNQEVKDGRVYDVMPPGAAPAPMLIDSPSEPPAPAPAPPAITSLKRPRSPTSGPLIADQPPPQRYRTYAQAASAHISPQRRHTQYAPLASPPDATSEEKAVIAVRNALIRHWNHSGTVDKIDWGNYYGIASSIRGMPMWIELTPTAQNEIDADINEYQFGTDPVSLERARMRIQLRFDGMLDFLFERHYMRYYENDYYGKTRARMEQARAYQRQLAAAPPLTVRAVALDSPAAAAIQRSKDTSFLPPPLLYNAEQAQALADAAVQRYRSTHMQQGPPVAQTALGVSAPTPVAVTPAVDTAPSATLHMLPPSPTGLPRRRLALTGTLPPAPTDTRSTRHYEPPPSRSAAIALAETLPAGYALTPAQEAKAAEEMERAATSSIAGPYRQSLRDQDSHIGLLGHGYRAVHDSKAPLSPPAAGIMTATSRRGESTLLTDAEMRAEQEEEEAPTPRVLPPVINDPAITRAETSEDYAEDNAERRASTAGPSSLPPATITVSSREDYAGAYREQRDHLAALLKKATPDVAKGIATSIVRLDAKYQAEKQARQAARADVRSAGAAPSQTQAPRATYHTRTAYLSVESAEDEPPPLSISSESDTDTDEPIVIRCRVMAPSQMRTLPELKGDATDTEVATFARNFVSMLQILNIEDEDWFSALSVRSMQHIIARATITTATADVTTLPLVAYWTAINALMTRFGRSKEQQRLSKVDFRGMGQGATESASAYFERFSQAAALIAEDDGAEAFSESLIDTFVASLLPSLRSRCSRFTYADSDTTYRAWHQSRLHPQHAAAARRLLHRRSRTRLHCSLGRHPQRRTQSDGQDQ